MNFKPPNDETMVAECVQCGKKIDLALSVLEFTPKRSAKVVSKTLLAAVANARDQQNVDEDRLYVKRATADTGPTWKRSLARAHMHSVHRSEDIHWHAEQEDERE